MLIKSLLEDFEVLHRFLSFAVIPSVCRLLTNEDKGTKIEHVKFENMHRLLCTVFGPFAAAVIDVLCNT